MTSFYSLRSTPQAGEFIIQKFDQDFACESVYALTQETCLCPAGHKSTCRHRKMIRFFLDFPHIDDGWFLDWDTRLWHKPLANANQDQPSGDAPAVSAPEPSAELDPALGEPVGVEPPHPPAPPTGSTIKRRKL